MSTEYVILANQDTGRADGVAEWQVIGHVTARSAKAAIRERVEGAAQSSAHYGDGEYVAVPARSWQPVIVKTETKTALRFS